jgi:FkbH-like protein
VTDSTLRTHSFRFAIAASFTAEPLRPGILFWGRHLHADFEVRFAPYNQIHQTLLDPASEFSRNTHGVNVVLARLEDLGGERLEENVRHLIEDLRAAPERFHVPLLFCLCPSVPSFAQTGNHIAAMIGSALDEAPGVHYLHHHEIDRLYPVEQQLDPGGDRLGHIPYTEAFYCALGTALVRCTHALMRAPFKLIALDCDNTLWQGICGEDGPENVTLDAPRRDLHETMLAQRDAGVLLTLASKNNEEDVLETFRLHPEMPLQLRHFVTWRLNWDTKADNLLSIADQLNIGADSFIFIDDNPKECAELEQALPEVVTLALPAVIERTPHFLQHVWAFDHPVVTEEDRNRSAYYTQSAEFGNEIRRAGSLEDFLAHLDLQVRISRLTPDKLPRTAQLTQRTNQFNTTTIRRNEADIAALPRHSVFTVDVTDRFGNYGQAGAMIVRHEHDRWHLDSMMLSCRVLGRGVEHRMLSRLGEEAQESGIGAVEIAYVRTAKSQPARTFLEGLPCGTRQDT